MADAGCPVCGASNFSSVADLQAHVNSHFEEPSPSRDAAPQPRSAKCPQCGQHVAPADNASHRLAHQLEAEDRAAAAAGDTAAAQAASEELDAQAAAELAAAEWGGGDSDEGVEDAAHRAQLEDLYFQQLRAKYGFTQAPRPGCCNICGEAGHWARECKRNPDVQEAKRRVVEPMPPLIAATQRCASPTSLPGGASLVRQLAGCLEAAAAAAPASAEYRAALCGEVAHFASTLYSSGWGCGYNNMQMLASHLLAAHPETRAVLFGGSGWVPDIAALQAWLEAAWRAGFDVQGAEQLEGRVQGTQKWVGTTECAALLRSFGVRAQIVDFGVDAAQAAAAAAAAAAAGGGRSGAGGSTRAAVGVHSNVECDGCGQRPIRGVRYTSQALPDYDLCGTCRGKPGAAAAGPFREMLPTAMAVPHPPRLQQQQQDGGSKGGSLHDQLLAWVWRYFMTDDDAQPSSRSGGSGEDGTAAGCAATGGSAVGGGNGVQPAAKRLCLQPSPVRMSGKSPLYFQHEGHSRTIIGIERRLVGRERRPEHTLLILDPGTSAASLSGALGTRSGWQRLLKRGPRTLRRDQYQLLFVVPGLAAGEELEALKTVAACERH